jgi:hypothetical protein
VVVLVPGLSSLQRERAGCVTIAINVGVCPGRESGDRPTPKVTQFARIVYEDKSDTNYRLLAHYHQSEDGMGIIITDANVIHAGRTDVSFGSNLTFEHFG